MSRSAPRSLALALGLVLAAVAPAAPAADAPAAAKPAARLKKNQVWVAPDWEARGIRSMAIAPLRSVERNVEAEAMARRGMEGAFHARGIRFRGAGSILESVQRSRADAAWAAAVAAAAKGAPLDSASAAALKEALSSDALLFASLTSWQRSIVDEQTRGSSFTQVGLEATMYSLADGAVVWRGHFVEKGDGPYNEPPTGDAATRDPSGYSGRRAALEPPGYEEVVEKLMIRVAAALPKSASAAAAKG